MPVEIANYITNYGYLAIFIMVFLQETGMPNPFPNELLLIFSGYLCYSGHLILPFVLIISFLADLSGTNILYFGFYFAGSFILKNKPKWIPLTEDRIEKLKGKILKNGRETIFIFRLTPFTRGYVSVICGLMRIPAKIYLPIAVLSAMIWASFYVILGYFLGPSWTWFSEYITIFKYIFLLIVLFLILIVIGQKYLKKQIS